MKPAIRALGLATTILWILIIVFSVTALQSIINLDIGFGEAQIFPSSKGMMFSLPFFINNTGYYDISELNVTTRITDYNGTLLALSKTFVPLVSRGSSVETAHNISVDLRDVMSMDYIQLFLNDSFFGLDTSIALNFAHIIPLQISTNATIPWGAPFSNFSVGEISVSPDYNDTHGEVVIPLSFENHAFFGITGTMQLETYNDVNELVASGKTDLDVPSQHTYEGQVYAYASLDDVSKLTESGNVRIIFETPMFIVDWWAPYG